MPNRTQLALTAGMAIALVATAALLGSPGATAEAVKMTPHVFVPTTVAIEARHEEPAPTF
jgi:hypothetical protein